MPIRTSRFTFAPLLAVGVSVGIFFALLSGADNAGVQAQTGDTPTPVPMAEQSDSSGVQRLPSIEGKLNPPKYPNMDSNLNRIVQQTLSGQFSAQAAAANAPLHSGASVAVTLYITEGYAQNVWDWLEESGADPRNIGVDYIEAYVQVSLLAAASQREGVISVRTIVPPQPAQGAVVSEGVAAHGAPAWHAAGIKGSGVKIGVIDVGFKDFQSLMGTELPSTVEARCYKDVGVFTSSLTDCIPTEVPESSKLHGTAVTEAAFDVAPEADYYIANTSSLGDLIDTVDWMAAEGVDVINMSLGFIFMGPGDGTTPFSDSPLRTVDAAVEGGIIWVNAAGNQARANWFGPFADTNANGVHEFSQADECNGVRIQLDPLEGFSAQLRWEDSWGGASSDLDLYLVSLSGNTFRLPEDAVGKSEEVQEGEADDIPFEIISIDYGDIPDGVYCLAVNRYAGAAPDWVQILVWGAASTLQHYTPSHSITNPAESDNPGLLAVGAAGRNGSVSNPFDTTIIEPFSSQGPTLDDRTKPDLVGADAGQSTTYRSERNPNGYFFGTSQASPHVAGLAGLVKQRFLEKSPQEIAQYLKDNAETHGTFPNNIWGYGFAKLPVPDSTMPEPTPTPVRGDINDPPRFDQPAQTTASIPEDAPAGYVVAIYNATDADGSDTLEGIHYELRDADDLKNFDIMTETISDGEIMGKLVVKEGANLDVDAAGAATSYTVEVNVKDADDADSELVIVITITDVNDNAPMFSTDNSVIITVVENAARGTALTSAIAWGGVYAAIDADLTAPNNTVTYSIDSKSFHIDSSTGMLTVLESLDADSGTPCGDAGCHFKITATDGGNPSMNDTLDVTVNVTNAEDSVITFKISKPNPVPGVSMGDAYSALADTKTGMHEIPERPSDQPATNGSAPVNFVEADWANWSTVVRVEVTAESPDDECGNGNQCVYIDVESDSAGNELRLAAYRSANQENLFIAAVKLVEKDPTDDGDDKDGDRNNPVYKDATGGVVRLEADEEDEVIFRLVGSTAPPITVDVENEDPEFDNFMPEHEEEVDDGGDVEYTFTVTDPYSGIPEPDDLPDFNDDDDYMPLVALISDSQCHTENPNDKAYSKYDFAGNSLWCKSEPAIRQVVDDRDFDEIDNGFEVHTKIVLPENEAKYVTFIVCDNAGNCAMYTPDERNTDEALAKITITPTAGGCVEAITDSTTINDSWHTDCESGQDPQSGAAAGVRYAKFYTFTLTQTRDVEITLESSTNTVLYLLEGHGADGRPLHDNDDHADESDCAADLGHSTDSCIAAALEAGGYTIEATTYDDATTGDFTLNVSGVGGAPTSAATDRAVLAALYNATDGDNWTEKDNWLTDEPLDEWYGITTDDEGRVTELNLTDNGLSGETPSELGRLTSLQILALGNNDLSGEIPSELGSLANLVELYLWGNDLAGEIPSELGDLSNIEYLSLVENGLTGEIPSELGSLARLESLRLWENELTGAIPSELGNLTRLEFLYLSDNQLTGTIPSELGNLTNLELLWLADNQLTGTIPSELGELANLTHLSLWGNELSGEIPVELGNLAILEVLDLGYNELTGEIPSELGSLTNLVELYLTRNDLTGEIPPELGNLANLTSEIPSELGNLSSLAKLQLDDNELMGAIPPALGSLSSLSELSLTRNDLTGEMSAELGSRASFGVLALGGNQLTGEIPSELGSLANLTELYLWGNDLTGEAFLPRLSELSELTHLDIGGNRFDGADVLPHATRLPKLVYLGLHDSRLTTDELMPHLTALSGLGGLNVGKNQLAEDQLLIRLTEFTNLNRLYLYDNQLTGEIPAELGSLSDLRILSLWGNELTGAIPPELGSLSDLEWLLLNDNQLTDPLPQSLTNLTALERFAFGDNAGLCAPADDAFQEWMQGISNEDLPEGVAPLGPNCEEPPEPPPTTDSCVDALAGDGAVNGSWTSDCDAENKSGTYPRYYTFSLSESADVQITLQSDTDTVLYLLSGAGRDGDSLYDNDDHADESDCAADLDRSTDSCIAATLEAGDYTIEATTYDVGTIGDFTLTVSGIG